MTQVRAVDRDAEDGPGPNGQVTYSIVSQHNKFTIDSNTGDLYTNAVRITKRTNGHGRVGRTSRMPLSFLVAYSPFEIPFWRPFPRRVTEIPESLPPRLVVLPPLRLIYSRRRGGATRAAPLSSSSPKPNSFRYARRISKLARASKTGIRDLRVVLFTEKAVQKISFIL